MQRKERKEKVKAFECVEWDLLCSFLSLCSNEVDDGTGECCVELEHSPG